MLVSTLTVKWAMNNIWRVRANGESAEREVRPAPFHLFAPIPPTKQQYLFHRLSKDLVMREAFGKS